MNEDKARQSQEARTAQDSTNEEFITKQILQVSEHSDLNHSVIVSLSGELLLF